MNHLFDARAAALALFLVLSAACEREPNAQHATDAPQAFDACELVRLSEPDLRKNTVEAQRGDLSAQRHLWSHYLCTDERRAAFWQNRLIDQNDSEALLVRSETLFSEAWALADDNPRKLALLQTAQHFEGRGRKARGSGVNTYLVNGKDLAVPYSSSPNDFTKRLQSEVTRLGAK